MEIEAMFEEWYANLPEADKAIEDKKAFARAGFIAGYNAAEHKLVPDGEACKHVYSVKYVCEKCGYECDKHLPAGKANRWLDLLKG